VVLGTGAKNISLIPPVEETGMLSIKL
jgi:hypothetical protein